MVTDEQSCQWDIIISKDLIHRTLIDASASACSPCSNTISIDVCTLLTHCILVNSSTAICWTSPHVILGVLGLFTCFYSIFDGKSC